MGGVVNRVQCHRGPAHCSALATIRAEISDLRAEMEKRFAEQTRWIVGTVVAVGALIVAVVKL